MEECKIKNLYNLDETIARDLLEQYTYPWEVLPHISEYILELGSKLPQEEFNKIGEDIKEYETNFYIFPKCRIIITNIKRM